MVLLWGFIVLCCGQIHPRVLELIPKHFGEIIAHVKTQGDIWFD